MDGCPFCAIPEGEILDENEYAVAVRDGFPVTEGHTLIITKRHVDDYFKLSKEEKVETLDLLEKMKRAIDDKYSPCGYNVGMNIGEAAGQRIQHVHIHLIPRIAGDAVPPRGSVKGVIRHKMTY